MENPVIIFISSSVLDSELTFMCQFVSHNQMHVMYCTYKNKINIGEKLNLANWRITIQSPNLNLANIL